MHIFGGKPLFQNDRTTAKQHSFKHILNENESIHFLLLPFHCCSKLMLCRFEKGAYPEKIHTGFVLSYKISVLFNRLSVYICSSCRPCFRFIVSLDVFRQTSACLYLLTYSSVPVWWCVEELISEEQFSPCHKKLRTRGIFCVEKLALPINSLGVCVSLMKWPMCLFNKTSNTE